MASFSLKIITPQGKFFDEETEALVAPGVEGRFGVLADHAAMAASLKEGELKITQNQTERSFTIGTGILEVDGRNSVLILTDYVYAAEHQGGLGEKARKFWGHPEKEPRETKFSP